MNTVAGFIRTVSHRSRTRVIVLGGIVVASMLGLSSVQAVPAAGPSEPADLSSTIILPDGRTIALRQWFSATGAGTNTTSDRDLGWVAPATTSSVDVVAIGGGGGGGGGKAGRPTANDPRGAGGGGGGGGEVRRDEAVSVIPGETLSLRIGAGGLGGAGAANGDVNLTPGASGGDGGETFLKRADSSVILSAGGGEGGQGGQNSGGGAVSTPGIGGDGGTGGSGGTLLTAGIAGVDGSNSATAPAGATGLDNSGSGWSYFGLRLAGGGGGGGGKSSNGLGNLVIGPGTTASTAAFFDLSDLTSTITRIGGDGDGGNDSYVSDITKNAPSRLGGGGGGGAFVFSSGRLAGRGGSGALLLTYAVADLEASGMSSTKATIPVSSGSTTITLQLRDADGVAADVSVGTVVMSVSGTDATLGDVIDNGDGTYTVTLTAGAVAGTATVTASVQGSALEPQRAPMSASDAGNTFASVAQVVIVPSTSPSTPTTAPTDLPDTGASPLDLLIAAMSLVLVGVVSGAVSRRRVI